MIAVWSFWSKPYRLSRHKTWASERHHLLSWILSVELARKHFCKTQLVTDEQGARMLVEGLKLEFDTVTTALDVLDRHYPRWWALGKIYTYRAQHEPFIHIDSDVYLWKPLPVTADTPLFAQNPEHFRVGSSFYKPELVLDFMVQHNGWLPEQWRWFLAGTDKQRAECCGVFGGNRLEFINYYADLAIRFIEHTDNRHLWAELDKRIETNVLVEQYLLSACIEYNNRHGKVSGQSLAIEYLFASQQDAFNPEKAAAAGYTHLIADSKKDATIANSLELRVEKDYPEAYQNCMRYIYSHR